MQLALKKENDWLQRMATLAGYERYEQRRLQRGPWAMEERQKRWKEAPVGVCSGAAKDFYKTSKGGFVPKFCLEQENDEETNAWYKVMKSFWNFTTKLTDLLLLYFYHLQLQMSPFPTPAAYLNHPPSSPTPFSLAITTPLSVSMGYAYMFFG